MTTGQPTQNYGGTLVQTNVNKAVASARLGSDQQRLFEAISKVVAASAIDLYGNGQDKKTRYTTDLILKRVEALIKSYSLKEFIPEIATTINSCLEEQAKEADKGNAPVTASELAKFGEALAANFQTLIDKAEEKKQESSKLATIKELQTFFGQAQQERNTDQSKLSVKANAFSKSPVLGKMLNDFSVKQAKHFAKLTGIVTSSFSDVSASMKSSQQFNTGKMTQVQKMLAEVQEGSIKTAKKISQMQENVSDALDSQSSMTSSRKSNIIKDVMKTALLASGKLIWKLVKAPLELLVVKPVKILFGLAKKAVMAPIDVMLGIVGKIYQGLLKGSFNILAGFLSTPAGMFALGYFSGWIWKNWLVPLWDKYIHPFFNEVKDFWSNYIKPIVQPFKQWFDGKSSFTEALEASWSKLKEIVWTNWIMPKLDNWFKPIAEMYTDICNWSKSHPQVAYRTIKLLLKPLTLLLKGLSWLTNPVKAVTFIKGAWTGKKVAEAFAVAASKSTQMMPKTAAYSASQLAKHGLKLNSAGRVINSAGRFVSAADLEKLGIKAFQKVAAKQAGQIAAKAGSKFVPGLAIGMSAFDFKDSWESFKKGNYKSSAAFFAAGLTGAAGGIAGLTGVGYPIQAALAAASTAASIAGATGEILEEQKQKTELLAEQQQQLQQLNAELATSASISFSNPDSIDSSAFAQSSLDAKNEQYLEALSDMKDSVSASDATILSMLEQIIEMLQGKKTQSNNYLFMPQMDRSQLNVGVK